MKRILFFFLFMGFLIGAADAQRRPDQFTKKSTAEGTDEIYSQAGGTGPYRITFDTARLYFIPDIYQTQLSVALDSTGTNVVDSLRGKFVLDSAGTWWYVDKDKTAVQITTTDAGDPDQTVSSNKVSNNVTVTLSGSGSNTTFSVADADSSATNETITALSYNGIELGITEAGVKTTVSLPADTVYALTYIADRTGIASPRKGDIAINAAGDSLAAYNGAAWATFAGGGKISATALSNDTLRITEAGLNVDLKLSKYTYTTDAVSDILALRLTNGTVIETRGYTTAGDGGGARYLIQADTVAGYAVDSVAVIPLTSGNYAVLQNNEYVYADWFGAKPDDGTADDTAIQKAINWAIKADKVNTIRFNTGEYDIDTGVIIGNQASGGTWSFCSLTLQGGAAVYGAVTESTVFDVNNVDGFGVAIQYARNIHIRNIAFIGGVTTPTAAEVVTNVLTDWGGGTYRTNKNSPYAAIVIDPFATDVTGGDQYPDFTSYYTHASNGGTSMVTIEGCSFSNFIVGVMNNPTNGGTNNGDNVVVRNARAEYMYAFWAAGQTQSRGNLIEDIYSTFIAYLIDCETFGNSQGTPPVLNGGNLAGMHKAIFFQGTNFSPFRAQNIYTESLYSIGINLGSTLSTFESCHLKLADASDYNLFQSPFVGYGSKWSFKNCQIEWFDNCVDKFPLYFAGTESSAESKVSFDNCYIQGGRPLGIFTNSPAENLFAFDFQNTYLLCESEAITHGVVVSGASTAAFDRITTSGTIFDYQGGNNTDVQVKILSPNYYVFSIGNETIDIDSTTYTATMITTDSDLLQVGDNLVTINSTSGISTRFPGTSDFRGHLGFVSAISGDTITINGVPHGTTEGAKTVYVVDYHRLIMPTFGDVTTGSDLITNVVTISADMNFKAGDRIRGKGIPTGAIVTSVSNDTITISRVATATDTSVWLYNAKFNQVINNDGGAFNWGYVKGDVKTTQDNADATTSQICTFGGVDGSSVAPVFATLAPTVYVPSISSNVVPKGDGTGDITDSQLYDSGTQIGIGTASPTDFVTINSGAANNYVRWHNNAVGATSGDGFVIGINSGGAPLFWNYEASDFRWNMQGGGSLQIENAGTDKLVISAATVDVKPDLKLSEYGFGTNTGTATYLLGVDALGNVTEEALSTYTNTDNQTVDTLSLSGTTLTLALESDGEAPYTVDLASINTDDQTLSFTTPNLSIEDGNSVDLTALDSLNALSMGGNIALNGNYLSGDGGNEGIYVDGSGNVGIGTASPAGIFHIEGSSGTVLIDVPFVFIGRDAGTNDAKIELGGDRTGNGNAYVDFSASTTHASTFSSRFLRNSGDNGTFDITNKGTGGMNFFQIGAGPVGFATAATYRMYIESTGDLRLQSGTDLEFTDGGPLITSGSGTPEGSVTAPIGSLYLRTDGSSGTTLYVKESGTGNTGWTAK